MLITSILTLISLANATEPTATDQTLQSILELAVPRLACNLSAVDQKKTDVLQAGKDGLKASVISPAKGSIVAADSKSNPDYYFHWTRDSALTARALVQLLMAQPGKEIRDFLHGFLKDYIEFSAKIQGNGSHYDVADPRANVDGSIDYIQWSRPQSDGPALQSLTLLLYFDRFRESLSEPVKRKLVDVVERDLDYIVKNVDEKSFDPWEENFGYHFYNRMVQLSALQEGQRVLGKNLKNISVHLSKLLESHWDKKQKFIKANIGELISWNGLRAKPPGGGLDTIVLLAVLHSGAPVSDELFSTVEKLETLFQRLYPMNHRQSLGPAMGRYEGDTYYGGNPWFVVTFALSEFYARLAENVSQNQIKSLRVTSLNQRLFGLILDAKLKLRQDLVSTPSARQALAKRLTEKSDAFFRTALAAIPSNGMVGEQFDMKTGTPMSSHDLSWSYAALISAALARDRVQGPRPTRIDWSRVHFHCSKK